jgi:Na+-translocating ferredoxin:NAD+ oxidoreductase RnfE subunit
MNIYIYICIYIGGNLSWNPTVNKMTVLVLRNLKALDEAAFTYHADQLLGIYIYISIHDCLVLRNLKALDVAAFTYHADQLLGIYIYISIHDCLVLRNLKALDVAAFTYHADQLLGSKGIHIYIHVYT